MGMRPVEAANNDLLGLLPDDEYRALAPHLERVTMPLGWEVFDETTTAYHVYFPIDSIVSILCVMRDGSCTELAVVGREGVAGVSSFMGGKSPIANRAVVQAGGEAYRLLVPVLKKEFARGAELQRLLLLYTHALLGQLGQTAACQCHHTVDQQLCRWLLLSDDRLPGNHLVMTQSLIADMLGVRRERVTQVAGKLQRAGLIAYQRGRIEIIDRQGLEARSCECYEAIHREYQRLLYY